MKKVSEVTKVDRQGVGWRMYLTDFPPCHEMVEAFASVSLHFTDDVPVAVWHNDGAEREFVSISVDTAHVFFGVDQAKSVREQLDAMFLFSAGATTGDEGPPPATSSVDGYSLDTSTAPAGPPQPTRPDPGLSEAWLVGKSDARTPWNQFPEQFTEETP